VYNFSESNEARVEDFDTTDICKYPNTNNFQGDFTDTLAIYHTLLVQVLLVRAARQPGSSVSNGTHVKKLIQGISINALKMARNASIQAQSRWLTVVAHPK
jgi:hypothetical protein